MRVHGLERKDALAPAPLGPHFEHRRGLGGRAALTAARGAEGPGAAAPPDQRRRPLHRAAAERNLGTNREREQTRRAQPKAGTRAPAPKLSQGLLQREVPAWLRGRVPIPRRLGPCTSPLHNQSAAQPDFAKAEPNACMQRACRRLVTPSSSPARKLAYSSSSAQAPAAASQIPHLLAAGPRPGQSPWAQPQPALPWQAGIPSLWTLAGCTCFCCVLSRSVVSDAFRPRGLQPARVLDPRGLSRQEFWSGLPCSPPGDLPNPGIEPRSPTL